MMQQINLYRPIFRKQEKKFSALAMAQASAAILVGIAIIYGLMYWQVLSLRDDLKQADQRLAAANRQLDDATRKLGVTAAGKTVEDEIAQLQKQVAARLRVRDILNRGLFSNTTGYSDFFVAFARHHVPGMWLTGFSITGAGEDMRLQGATNDPAQVPRYMQRLSREERLAGREFQVFTMSRPEKKPGEAAPSHIEFLLRTGQAKEQGKS